MADLNKIGNPSSPVYPVEPVGKRDAPPRRSPQGKENDRNQEQEDSQNDSHIDEFA